MWPTALSKESSSSGSQVASTVYRRVAGGQSGGILAAALWQNQQKNVHDQLTEKQEQTPLVRRFKRQRELHSTTSIDPPSTQDDTLRTVKKVVLSVVMGMYVIHPLILLWLFRSPELFSLLGVFQIYHKCSGTLTRSWSACMENVAMNLFLFFPSFGGIWLWLQSGFSLSRKFLITFSCLLAFKISVDHVFLFHIPSNANLEGKVALITGANRGIGLATSLALADLGAHCVITCRSMEKCQPVVDQIQGKGGKATAAVLDLNSLESAMLLSKYLSTEFPAINYFFANAGTTPQYALTEDGFENGFGSQYLAHMAVVLGILPSLERAGSSEDPARVIMVSSEMALMRAMGIFGSALQFSSENRTSSVEDNMQGDWRGERTRGDGTIGSSLPAYGRAKLSEVLFAFELNRRLAKQPIVAHAVHTGAVVTDSSRDAIVKTFSKWIPGLRWLVGRVYFPVAWRHVHGGARSLLCPALSRAPYILKGGQYLDALCRPFSHDVDQDPSRRHEVTIPFFGEWRTITFSPVLAFLLADVHYSKRLWNLSVEFIRESPAADVLDNLDIMLA